MLKYEGNKDAGILDEPFLKKLFSDQYNKEDSKEKLKDYITNTI